MFLFSIHTYQYGFRQGYSAESQLITVTEDIIYAMDHKLQTDVILLDFQKAFNIVPHQRLLSKLSSYGIQNETHSWINSWLTQRKQRVIVDGSASACMDSSKIWCATGGWCWDR